MDNQADAGYSIREAIWHNSDVWDEAAITRRPWIAAGYFLRGSVTTIVGPGGVSKSTLVIAYAVALALGIPFHTMCPNDCHRSLIYNVEDDDDEQRRRLSAVLKRQDKTPKDIAGQIHRCGPNEIGTLFDRDSKTGEIAPTSAMGELECRIKSEGIDILFVDPLAELHTVEENDNGAMRGVVAAFRGLAVRNEIAVVIIHHTRKGPVIPGDPDAGRGASAVSGASRVVITINGMSQDECKAFGLPSGSHKRYFRVDGAKANYSSLTDCEWFERTSYTLANGDIVSVPIPWLPPKDAITPDVQAKVEAAVAAGSPTGPWSPKLEDRARSIKNVMLDAGITTVSGQKDMLAALQHAGFAQARFKDGNRKWATGIKAPDGRPDNWEWEGKGGA